MVDEYMVKTMGKEKFRTLCYPKCVGTFPDCPKIQKNKEGNFIGECIKCPYGGQFKGILPKIPIKEDPFARKKS